MDEVQFEVVGVNTRLWGEDGGAYSEDGCYRWSYERPIGRGSSSICWIGLNPGTGDSEGRYRPTLQRMVDRSLALGMGRFVLVNLFAWRATKPADLRRAHADREDIIGRRCDESIVAAADGAAIVVAAWGSHGKLLGRDRAVLSLLDEVRCLGMTAKGMPRHPLYVSAAQQLIPLEGPPR